MEDGGDVVVKNGSVSAHRMSRYTIYRLELISQPERKGSYLEFIALYQSDLLGNIKLTNLGETPQDQQPADAYTGLPYLAASVSFVLAMASRIPMGIRVGNSVDVLQ
ncbi:hypothetical protein BYT27DRAFT_7250384 [Phlegmacium glaucopus]|nr:hypothetical protein BYT27DRAFT_7250384 [Phlegmacium glaucopus]